MQMPIDIKAVLEAATNTKQAADTHISISVWIDEGAPAELIAHVRAAFASASANTKVTIAYLSEGAEVPVDAADDVAVIVAGLSERIGEQAAYIRSVGVPVMVTTTLPHLVGDMAVIAGHPIPEGDIVFPGRVPTALDTVKERLPLFKTENGKAPFEAEVPYKPDAYYLQEPIAFNENTAQMLDIRMGKWIVTTCKTRKLAFALAFPFVRRPLAIDSIKATSIQNAAIGFVPIISGADMPLMTINQVKMLLQIAVAYGEPLTTERIKELAALVAGAFVCRHIVRSITKVVPFAGWIVSGVVGYTATEAFGYAAIEYFEAGGDLKGIAAVIEAARDEGVEIAKNALNSPAGQVIADSIKGAAKDAFQGKAR